MATSAQMAANQLNAQKSTGPKSTTGKQVSSMNAVTHGIFVTNPIAEGENVDEFNQLSDAVISVYNPVDFIEEVLVEKIIYALWRQKRARSAETAMINLSRSRKAIAADTNTLLKIPSYSLFTEEDIFDDHSARYQNLLKLQKELSGLDFNAVAVYPQVIKGNAPTTYKYLPTMAKRYQMSFDQLLERPETMKKALNELLEGTEKDLGMIDARKNAHDTAELIKQTKVVPSEESSRLIMTYEARADNAYAKAVDALRKHRLDKQKVIEAEIISSH